MKLSEPDVRTPEQIEAARQASQSHFSHGNSSKVACAQAGLTEMPQLAQAVRRRRIARNRSLRSRPSALSTALFLVAAQLRRRDLKTRVQTAVAVS